MSGASNGRARSAMNAVAHGITAKCLLVGTESEAAWLAHRESVVAAIAPETAIETELAERVAVQLWRLRRVPRFEAKALRGTDSIEAASPLLAHAKINSPNTNLEQFDEDIEIATMALEAVNALSRGDDSVGEGESLALCYVREVAQSLTKETINEHNGTAREALDAYAVAAGVDASVLVSAARKVARDSLSSANVHRALAEVEVKRRREACEVFPSEELVERVTRYEAHLERSLLRTLAEIDRARAFRWGLDGAVPRSMNLTVSRG